MSTPFTTENYELAARSFAARSYQKARASQWEPQITYERHYALLDEAEKWDKLSVRAAKRAGIAKPSRYIHRQYCSHWGSRARSNDGLEIT